MEKKDKLCANCNCRFYPKAHLPNQIYCSKKECQKARKAKWARSKIKNDNEYRESKKISQHKWRIKHQDYWKKYRAKQVGNRDDGQTNKKGNINKEKQTQPLEKEHRAYINFIVKKEDIRNLVKFQNGIINCELRMISEGNQNKDEG
ncbi:MAG: hypothetical protein KKE11_06135 [Gammaproteobacteria bacterium]|nr:hypothetical protein [Gammaproteobacteria bacterium]